MAGTFGYELNLGKLSEEEKEEIRSQVEEYRKFAPLIQTGLYYRLSDPSKEEYAAWAFVSEDQKEVLRKQERLIMAQHLWKQESRCL